MQKVASVDCLGIPAYSVRESERAKHVSIKVLETGALQVVVPLGYDRRRIPDILHRKRTWITRTTERVKQRRSQFQQEQTPPITITLTAIGETWHVSYLATATNGVTLVEKRDRSLLVRGNTENHRLCCDVLRRWLTRQGQRHLVPWLHTVSQQCALPFTRVGIRGQKTLWGSCSREKSISLNYKLLFLPPHLVSYVFIHELCHTVHMNHSTDFWALVGSKLANYRQVDRELRHAMSHVPSWVSSMVEQSPSGESL
jgi:predicted metal-dependent hydrolase